MEEATAQRLLALNREFYATVAESFDATRAGLPIGWQQLKPYLPHSAAATALQVLDVGCGNGRFARALAQWHVPCTYLGVDGDARLLALATENTAALPGVTSHFQQVDFTRAGWAATVGLASHSFDLVVCLAALHHVPGYALRRQVVQELANLLAPAGVLIFSHWQFLTSERFVRKQIAWQTIGLQAQAVEAGDALLPWRQGHYAVRYVHQIDEAEMRRLATDTGLAVTTMFYADGKEGNLNLYAILKSCKGTM